MSQLIRIVIFFIIFYIVYLSVDWIRHYPGIFRSIFSKINDDRYFNYTLNRLLIPRWPMSRGHDEVLNFIFDNLKNLGFEMFRDEFIDRSKFTNIVAIMNSRANNFLMLSCHYDSKLLKESDNYVGATDGAVSCAILLNMAHSLKSYLNGALKNRNDIGLLLVFFDGHESLNQLPNDQISLNGSRHFSEVETIRLDTIEVAVTLNLIGAPGHIYMSHYESTFALHNQIADVEAKLKRLGKLSECHQLFHKLKDHDSDFEDDHYPLINEGVGALHIVPHTFPANWHTEADNLTNLHWPTIENMNRIITRFVYEYLEYHETTH